MLKKWHDNNPYTFGAVIVALYITIPILDSRFIYPKMKPVCNGQITDQQVRSCTSWIIKKETKHVPESTSTTRGLLRGPQSDSELQWKRTLDTFGRP